MPLYCILFLLLLFSNPTTADSFRIAVGESSTDDKSPGSIIAYQLPIHQQFDLFKESNFTLDLEIEYFIWNNYEGNNIRGGAISPIFRYNYYLNDIPAFIGFGIGVSYISQSYWHERDLGANWQFEDTLEFGIKVTKFYRLSLGIKHYSNASTNKQNDGVNIYYLGFDYDF